MNLDDYTTFPIIDKQDMLSQIESLPDQLLSAWQLGSGLDLPGWKGIERVLIAGMGGSAIGADLLAAYIRPVCKTPVIVHRDYDLPAWANGQQTLVVLSSHSGNTEETLSAFDRALNNGCLCLVISTGGKLEQVAVERGVPYWIFEHTGQPRAAVGYSFGLLLALLSRLELIENPEDELREAVITMLYQQNTLRVDIPVGENPAKRLAGQVLDRWVTVIGSGVLAPVARRWKGQISEVAKAWSQFEYLPEVDHNTLAGVVNPEPLLSNLVVLFLQSSSDHPRNILRSDLTRKIFMVEGLGTDAFDALGDTPLAIQWTCLHFGDYMAYYLAMAYGVDPTPVAAIENFKRELSAVQD